MGKRIEKALEYGRIKALLNVLKLTDEEAYVHSIETANLVEQCLDIAESQNELEWNERECESIIIGTLLHDIGKAFLPFGLQHTSNKLDIYEKSIINIHPILGVVIIRDDEFDEIVNNIVLYHHEYADGTGYPILENKIMKEEDIPDYVWLVAYADKFEAMTSKRSFKIPKTYPEAWNDILTLSREGKLPYKFTRLFGALVKDLSLLPIKEEDPLEITR